MKESLLLVYTFPIVSREALKIKNVLNWRRLGQKFMKLS